MNPNVQFTVAAAHSIGSSDTLPLERPLLKMYPEHAKQALLTESFSR